MRRAGVLLLLLTTGCAAALGPAAGPTAGPTGGLARPPVDPCALVTERDVEEAVGGPVRRSGVIPANRMLRPPGVPPTGAPLCEYVVGGNHMAITVRLIRDGRAEFDEKRLRDPANTRPVPGLGDDAFTYGLAAMFVRVGEDYFVLVTQHGAGSGGVADLERLARAALAGQNSWQAE